MSKFGRIGHKLYTGEISYDFIGHRRRWYIFSAILLTVAILATLIRGLNFGIEFTGGADFQAPTQVTSTSVERMETALRETGVPGMDDVTITTIGNSTIRVQTQPLNSTTEVPKVRDAIAAAAGTTPDKVADSQIGASWGDQITERALIALAVFLALVAIVIWVYFRNGKMALSALVALAHDLILTVGIYALVGFTVTPATMIGVLTILGYSLYDTVVVFDKVRENVRDIKASTTKTYSEAANLAVNQVLVRSINTTVIGVLPVAALLFAGGAILGTGPLKDLALALFVGMISGAYSSIFIATPLLAQLKEREPDMIKQRRRVENRRAREAGKTVTDDETPTRRKTRRSAETDDSEPEETTGEKVAVGAGRTGATSSGGSSSGGTSSGGTSTGGSPSSGRSSESSGQQGTSTGGTSTIRLSMSTSSGTGRSSAPVSDGAAKRPQPQKKPRSQRKK